MEIADLSVPASWGGRTAGAAPAAPAVDASAKRRGRVGIGAEALVQRKLEEERKEADLRKGMLKRPRADGDEEAPEPASDSEEESRSSAVRRRVAPPAAAGSDAAVLAAKAAKAAKNRQKRQNKKNKKAAAPAADPPVPNFPPVAPEQAEQAEQGDQAAAAAAAPADGDALKPWFGKKRKTKTRSKQKNIRRDKRALDSRPEHLRVGSKDYAGRPITQATRDRLGLEDSQRGQQRRRQKHEEGADK